MAKEQLSCCGGYGKHLNGCSMEGGFRTREPTRAERRSDRKKDKHDAVVAKLKGEQKRQKREAKKEMIGRRLSELPVPGSVPNGCHVEKNYGTYMVVRDEDSGSFGKHA